MSSNYKQKVAIYDTRGSRSPHQHKLPFAPTNISPPSPLGPFAPPYQCWLIPWDYGIAVVNARYSPEASRYTAVTSRHNPFLNGDGNNTQVPVQENPPRYPGRYSTHADRSYPHRYTYPSGANYRIPARGASAIPNTVVPMQESREQNFVYGRSNTVSSLPRDTIRAPSPSQKGALLRPAQHDMFGKSYNEVTTGRIVTDENVVFDKYNILGFLFDENKDDIRDHSSSQRDPVPKRRIGIPKPKSVRKPKTTSSYYSCEEREPQTPARSTHGRSSERTKKKKSSRERRSSGNLNVLENRGAVSVHPTESLPKDGNHGVLDETKGDTAMLPRATNRSPSKDDVAINLLCPYHHPPNQSFVICHETPNQKAFRHRILGSPSCVHLMGKFTMEFFPHQTLRAGVIGGKWRIRRV